jgi:hypothetical protein
MVPNWVTYIKTEICCIIYIVLLDVRDNLHCQYLCIGAQYQQVTFYFKLITITLPKITNVTNLAHLLIEERMIIPLIIVRTSILYHIDQGRYIYILQIILKNILSHFRYYYL